jgi:hypothetical protein
MKLCPHCEFIYEDDQSFCDMDGKELIHDATRSAFAGIPSSASPKQVPAAVSLVVRTQPELIELIPTSRQSRSFALAAVVGVVLIALLLAVYYKRINSHPGSVPPVADQSRSRSDAAETGADALAGVSARTPASAQLPGPEASSSASLVNSAPVLATESPSRTRLAGGAVSASGSAGDNKPAAIIWLKNGSSIRADEVWEKAERVWYRQAGLVTFVKRGQVARIQRLDSRQISKPEPARRATETARNERPIAREDTENAHQESRVGSFLKKTGRILKKPFKF